MYKKTFWEHLGDMLSDVKKRFFLGLASVFLLGPFGVLIALSILETKKTYFVKGITVRLSNGEVVPCTVVKQKCYAYMPVVPFVCFFFYVPYKTQYYLLKNVAPPNAAENSCICDFVPSIGILNAQPLCRAEITSILDNPQSIAVNLEKEIEASRMQFCEDFKPFAVAGMLEEVYYDHRFSICKFVNEESHLLFHYDRSAGCQRGLSLENIINNQSELEQIKRGSLRLLDLCLLNAEWNFVDLNDDTYERLIRFYKPEMNETVQKTQEEIDARKTVLDKAMIIKAIRGKSIDWKTAFGGILAYISLGGLSASILGVMAGPIVVTCIAFPLTCLTVYYSIRNFKTAKKNRKNLTAGKFTIIKTKCTHAELITEDDYTSFKIEFENGEKINNHRINIRKNDYAYLVYLEGANKAGAVFSSLDYRPDQNLTVTEYIPEKTN